MTTDPAGAVEPWVPSDDTFGARLALIRQRMGWNAKEASLACGLPQNSWRGWEMDARKPRNVVEVAGLIAARTGVDDYWLLTGRRSPRPGDPDGGSASSVRPEGFEPPTFWFGSSDATTSDDTAVVLPFPVRHPTTSYDVAA